MANAIPGFKAVDGMKRAAKSLGQIAGPVLGGVLFGAAVAVPFWLAGGLLLGVAPFFAWRVDTRTAPPGSRAATDTQAVRE